MDLELLNQLDQSNNFLMDVLISSNDSVPNIFPINGLNCIFYNIRSINRNLDEFLLVLQQSNLKNFDILVLGECRLGGGCPSMAMFNILGYSSFCTKNNFNQNSGLVVYIKDELLSGAIIEEHVMTNCNCFTLSLNNPTGNIEIVCLYRSPSGDLDLFITEVEQFLNRNTIVLGDINVDILDNKVSTPKYNYMSAMVQAGFLRRVTHVTRPSLPPRPLGDVVFDASTARGISSSEQGSCLDHIFSNVKDQSKLSVYVLDCDTTDHRAILFSYKSFLDGRDGKGSSDNSFKISRLNHEQLLSKISVISWDEIYESVSADKGFELLVNTLSAIITECTTETVCRPNSKLKAIKPWMSKGLMTSLRRKHKLYLKLKAQPFNGQLHMYYNRYKNKFRALIRDAKDSYYKNKIDKVKNDSKKIWELVNEAVNNYKRKNCEINALEVNGQVVSTSEDPLSCANAFNEYFANVGLNMAGRLPSPSPGLIDDGVGGESIGFEFTSVDEAGISEVIGQLRGGSGPGWDGIGVRVLQDIKSHIAKPLAYLINLSLGTGVFPQCMKLSIVRPLYKNKDHKVMSNYRPISLLSNISKITEKIVKKQLVSYLESNNILSERQFGFRKGMSTHDAIDLVTSEIYANLDGGKKSLSVFLDLAKAFDTVSHSLLINKLERLGLGGTALAWFKCYLGNRMQKVKLNNTLSSPVPCPAFGVPQGTVLGPVLFLVFMNDLSTLETIIDGRICMFADDTALLFHSSSWSECHEKAARGLRMVKRWLDNNLLTLNVEKTRCIAYSLYENGQPPQQLHLKLHNFTCDSRPSSGCTCSVIERVSNMRYLGVQFDQHINWKSHIDLLSKRVRQLSYYFYRLKNIVNNNLLKIIYFSLVQSVLTYGILAWGGAYPTLLRPACIAQNNVLRSMLGRRRYDSASAMYNQLSLLTLRDLFILNTLKTVNISKDKFEPVSHGLGTRGETGARLNVPRRNTTQGMRHWSVLGPRLYNLLPHRVKTDANFYASVKTLLHGQGGKIFETAF